MISSFYPVVAGRVTDSLIRNRSLYQVQADQIGIQKLQNQLSTGLRYMNPSEDPSSAIRVIGLQQSQEFKTQTLSNLKSAKSYLGTTESALSNTSDILDAVKGIAVSSVGTLVSQTDRDGMVAQLDGYMSRLVALGNQYSQDRYLFSGGDVGQQPLQQQTNSITFNGDDLDLIAIADRNEYLSHNVTSQRALGVISDGIRGSQDLNPSLSAATKLKDLNDGRGVPPGAIQFSDGSQTITLDLASAEKLGDVVTAINNTTISNRALTATIGAQGILINYADGQPGTIRISNSGSGQTASQLGIATNTPQPALPIVGSDIDPAIRGTTLLSQLNGGTGLNVTGGFKIIQGGVNYNVDLSAANNVEDLLNSINRSGADVIADVDPGTNSIRVRSVKSGVDFSIAETTGTVAGQLGLRTFNGNVLLSDLNYGRGLELTNGPDLSFKRADGTEFQVDLQGAVTVQDALDKINNSIDNQDPVLKITASIDAASNRIVLSAVVPTDPPLPDPPLAYTPVPISVESTGGSSAAIGLGLVPLGSTSKSGTTGAGSYVIGGTDPNPQEVHGVFNTILRLKAAIKAGNSEDIGRATALLDDDVARLSLARSDVGIRLQRIDALQSNTEDSLVDLKSQESDERDVDFAQTLSEFTARQTAYEANLSLLSKIAQTTIFDYV